MLPGKRRAGDAALGLLTVVWRSVASKLREIILDFGFSSQDLLGQQVLFVQEEDDRNCP